MTLGLVHQIGCKRLADSLPKYIGELDSRQGRFGCARCGSLSPRKILIPKHAPASTRSLPTGGPDRRISEAQTGLWSTAPVPMLDLLFTLTFAAILLAPFILIYRWYNPNGRKN